MTGTFRSNWQQSWREVWKKLAGTPQAPPDLFIQLFDVAIDYLIKPPVGNEYDIIHNDPTRAREAFRRLKGEDFKNESAVVAFLETAHRTISGFGNVRLVEGYVKAVKSFIAHFNLRYRVLEPFSLRQLLSGTFAALYAELEKLNGTNSHLAGLMEGFEQAFDSYIRSQHQGDLTDCISKASIYAEGVAAAASKHTGTLAELCNELKCWPHKAVKGSIKTLYGFCSDYPGIRHAGNAAGKLRNLEGRDALLLSIILVSFSGYITEGIFTGELIGTTT
jgi:hypothetical protein